MSAAMADRESFSPQNPSLQLAWDSTSIGEAKTCWRKYQYSILEGWMKPDDNIHLDFGIYFHSATETYDRAKATGASHLESVDTAISRALSDTWRKGLDRPWDSMDPNKNRGNLIRSIVWYYEQFEDDSLQTVILPNGKPAVELSFSIETAYKSRLTGDNLVLCGHLDRLVNFNGDIWISDKKTTKYTLNSGYFGRFTPDNQISCYSVAGSAIFAAPIKGVIIDAAQIAVNFTRFQRGFVPRSKSQLEEWMKDLYIFFAEYEGHVERGYFPMNDKVCGIPHTDEKTGELRGGCQYREICSASPEMRQKLLELNFKKRLWDPIKTREI